MDALGGLMPKLSTKNRRFLVRTGDAIAVIGTGFATIAAVVLALAISPLMVPLMLLSQYLCSFEIKENSHDPNCRQNSQAD